MKDYYKYLEVPSNALPEEIKKQWRFLVNAWHPDKFPDTQRLKAEEKIKNINEAYEILSDPISRSKYDRERSSRSDLKHEEEPHQPRVPKGLHVVDSLVYLQELCKKGKVLLFTIGAEKGWGERNKLKDFTKHVLPHISSLAESKNVILCYSNVERSLFFPLSEIGKYLQERNMRFLGCFLFIDGEIQISKKVGFSEWHTNAARLMLESLG